MNWWPITRYRFGLWMLIYLVIPLMFASSLPPLLFALTIVWTLLFAYVYGLSYSDNARLRGLSHAVQALLILLAIAVFNVGYIYTIYYPAWGAGLSYSWIQLRKMLAGFLLTLALEVLVLTGFFHVNLDLYNNWPSLVAGTIGLLASIAGARWQRTLQKKNAQLAAANREIERLAQVAERERISRDLHDVLGHTLSLITLKAALASRLTDKDTASAKQEIQDIESTARTALSQVRDYISGLREANITTALRDAQYMLQLADIECMTTTHPGEGFSELAPSQIGVIAFAIQEAATNMVRHSHARHAFFGIYQSGEDIRLIAADDGIGIDPSSDTAMRHQGHHGLQGMKARAELVNGWLDIKRIDESTAPLELSALLWKPTLCISLSIPITEGRDAPVLLQDAVGVQI